MSKQQTHLGRIIFECFVATVGLPLALMLLTKGGAHSRVFVVAFGLLLVPGVLLLDQWSAHRGKVALGIAAGAVLAGIFLYRLGDFTTWAIPKARWIIEHRIASGVALGVGLGVTAIGLFIFYRKRWPNSKGLKSSVTALLLGGIGGVVLTLVLALGLTWQGRYGYSGSIVVPSLAVNVGPYVAVGDSYAAGEGLQPFIGGDSCHRSTQYAFGELIKFDGKAVLDTSNNFRACSGARSRQVYEFQQNTTLKEQIPPGSALIGPKTGLITIIMGGNDLHFSSVLIQCATQVNCLDMTFAVSPSADETDVVGSEALRQWAPDMITVLGHRLATLFARLRTDAPSARIIVVGYPHLLPTGRVPRQFDYCDTIVAAIDSTERDWLAGMQTQLAAKIRTVAEAAGTEFIDPTADFASHEVCGIRGELIHSTNLALNDPGMFHPTVKGQRLLAREVVCYLNQNPQRPAAGTRPVLSTSSKDSNAC